MTEAQVRKRGRDLEMHLTGFEGGEEIMNQVMQTASRSCKRQRNRFYPRNSRKKHSAIILILELTISKTIRE